MKPAQTKKALKVNTSRLAEAIARMIRRQERAKANRLVEYIRNYLTYCDGKGPEPMPSKFNLSEIDAKLARVELRAYGVKPPVR